jgi:hypothetical protein
MTETLQATSSNQEISTRIESVKPLGSQLEPIKSRICEVSTYIELRKSKNTTPESKFRDQLLDEQLQQLQKQLINTTENLDAKSATTEVLSKNSKECFSDIRDFQNFTAAVGANSSSKDSYILSQNLFEHLTKIGVAQFNAQGKEASYYLFADAIENNERLKPYFSTLRELFCHRETKAELEQQFIESKYYKQTQGLNVYTSIIRQPVEPVGSREMKSEQKIEAVKQEETATQESEPSSTVPEVLTQLTAQLNETKEDSISTTVQEQQTLEVAQTLNSKASEVLRVLEASTAIEVATIQRLQRVLATVESFPAKEQKTVVESWIPLFELSGDLVVVDILTEVLNTETIDIEADLTAQIQTIISSSQVTNITTAQTSADLTTSTNSEVENSSPVTFKSIDTARTINSQNRRQYETIPLQQSQSRPRTVQNLFSEDYSSRNDTSFYLDQTTPDLQDAQNPITESKIRYSAFKENALQTSALESTFTPLENLSRPDSLQYQSYDFKPPFVESFTTGQDLPSNPQTADYLSTNTKTDPSIFDYNSLSNIKITPPISEPADIFKAPNTASQFNPFSSLQIDTPRFSPAPDYQSQVIPPALPEINSFSQFSSTRFEPPQNIPEISQQSIETSANEFNLNIPQTAFVPPEPTIPAQQTQPSPVFESPITSFQPPAEAANNIVSFSRKSNIASSDFNSPDNGSSAGVNSNQELVAA